MKRLQSVPTLVLLFGAVIGIAAQAPPPAGAPEPGAPLAADRTDPELERRTEALIRDMSAAPHVAAWFEAHAAEIVSAVAVAADAIAARQLQSGQVERAAVTLMFAAFAHMQLGERAPALERMLDLLQIQFMRADDREAYGEVRETALAMAQKAESVDRRDLRFAFATIAADAAYFQSETAAGRDETLLLTALEDLTLAMSLATHASSRQWTERLVSLTGALVNDATGTYHRDQDKFDALLRRIAAATESAIPADFDFTVEALGDRRKAIAVARELAGLSYQYGNAGVASARLAVAERNASALQDPELLVSVISQRYRSESRKGASADHLRRLGENAWSQAQAIRAAYRSRAGRIWAAFVSDDLYGQILKGQIAERAPGRVATAFTYGESLKARTLLDRVTLPRAVEIDTAETRGLERTLLGFNKPRDEGDLLMAEMRLISQLSAFRTIGSEDAQRSESLRRLEELYAAADAGLTTVAPPASLAAVQAALAPDEALLEFLIPYHALHPAQDLWMALVTRARVWTAHIDLDEVLGVSQGITGRIGVDGQAPIDSSALGDLVTSTRVAIRTADEATAKKHLQVLHELLIQPLIAQGVQFEAFGRVIVVPHGMLHYVPFAALVGRDGRFLISKVPIVLSPSASIWVRLQSRTSTTDRLVVLANPELADRQFAPLRFAAEEAAGIARTAPAADRLALTGPAATKARFFSEAATASLLHLSTHGEFPDDNALDLHAIRLAAENNAATGLTAAEVRKANLASVRLVVLSVCNGGLYRIGPSDEPYGLMPAFFEAGAHNVMGTLWSLDDQFGRDFMLEYYQHLAKGPAEAHRQATLRFVDDEYIRRWAGFVLVGSGRPFGR